MRAAVEVAAHRHDAAGLRHREGLRLDVSAARPTAAGHRVLRVRDAGHDAQPVRRDRGQLGRIDGHAVLHVRLAALVAMVHRHPDHLPVVGGGRRVSITTRQRERPELLAGAVEALLDGIVRAGTVLARVIRAAVREHVVVKHQLRLRDLVAARIDDPGVHADDRAGHGRRLHGVVVPEGLVAADAERPDPEHVRLERRIRVMPRRRRRDLLERKLRRRRVRRPAGSHQEHDNGSSSRNSGAQGQETHGDQYAHRVRPRRMRQHQRSITYLPEPPSEACANMCSCGLRRRSWRIGRSSRGS